VLDKQGGCKDIAVEQAGGSPHGGVEDIHTQRNFTCRRWCQKIFKLWKLDRDFEFIFLSKLWFKIER
jgi:hypothetical protein